jgi:hypothetical protein
LKKFLGSARAHDPQLEINCGVFAVLVLGVDFYAIGGEVGEEEIDLLVYLGRHILPSVHFACAVVDYL